MSVCEQKREKKQERQGHTHSHIHVIAQPAGNCPICASDLLHKNGLRYLKDSNPLQRWLCRKCGRRFSEPRQAIWENSKHGGVRDTSPQEKELTQSLLQNKAAGDKPTTEQTLDNKNRVLQYAFWLKKEGYSTSTILSRSKLLGILVKRGADLHNQESVKEIIAEQSWSQGRKANAVDAYTSFLRMTGGSWEPPRYQGVRRIPFIPMETEVDQLIAGCSPRMGTFLQLLKETGMRCGEAWELNLSDVDATTKVVRVTPEKNSNPRICHISQKLAAMLDNLPKTYGNRVFSNPQQPLDHFRDNFSQQRKRMAHKLKNPRLLRITFHTLRHFKGTMEYHRTKDIVHVMQVLGHKNMKNTLLYVQLAEELFKDQQEYVSKVAKTEADVCALIDSGFEYVCDFEDHKILRKRKF